MSHLATNWAIRQRGIGASAKVVLWHLCDRYNPDFGCFVSQVRLADDAEVSKSQLNVILDDLEGRSLIRRVKRRDRATGRQGSTLYRFPFEDGFDDLPALREEGGPSPETGLGGELGEAADEAGAYAKTPSPETGLGEAAATESGKTDLTESDHRVRNPDSNLVRTETVSQPKRDAREIEEKWLGDLKARHPQVAHESAGAIDAAWGDLKRDQRKAAHDRHAAWLAERGKRIVCSLGTYLREKRWELVQTGATPATITGKRRVDAFDRAWWFLLYDYLERNPNLAPETAARRFYERQVSLASSVRIGWEVEPEELAAVEEKALTMVKQHIDGAAFAAWRHVILERRGVHLPIPSAVDWVFTPSGEASAWSGAGEVEVEPSDEEGI